MYKLDKGSNSNRLPCCIFKITFPKSANKGRRQLKTCKLKIMHNEKQKICMFVVVQDGSSAVLVMADIDKLSLISFNCETTQRQVATDCVRI